MHHPEAEHGKDAVKAAERILKEGNTFNAESVIDAAEEIVATAGDRSQVVEVDLSPQMLEFLSSIYCEQNILDQDEYTSGLVIENLNPSVPLENASAILFDKFARLNQLSDRFPGKTPLSRREIDLIKEHIAYLISDLQKRGDFVRLKIFTKLSKKLHKEFAKAENHRDPQQDDRIEGTVVLEPPIID